MVDNFATQLRAMLRIVNTTLKYCRAQCVAVGEKRCIVTHKVAEIQSKIHSSAAFVSVERNSFHVKNSKTGKNHVGHCDAKGFAFFLIYLSAYSR